MKVITRDENETTMRLSKEQAVKNLKHHLKFIKKTIKKRIALYEPLTFKTAYTDFLKWAQAEDYRGLQEIPAATTFEYHLEHLVKNFLIEKTYFHFLFEAEDMVMKFVVKISKNNGIPLSLSQDIAAFVREKLENKEKLAAVKRNFKEGSKLKTYFFTMTRFAVFDYGRENRVKVELEDTFDPDQVVSSAPQPHIKVEEKEIKERVAKLEPTEQLAVKMYYYRGITNFCLVARTLNTSRHKAKKILEQAVEKILKGNV